MRPGRSRAAAFRGAALALIAIAVAGPGLAAHINVVTISGSINPASSDYLQKAIALSSAFSPVWPRARGGGS